MKNSEKKGDLKMENERVLRMLEAVEKNNPYPEDIFSDIDYKEAVVIPAGKRERLFAKFGRNAWNHCVEEMRKAFIDEMEEMEGGLK